MLKLSPWALLPSPWQKCIWCPHYIDAALAWTQPTILGWLIPQRWPSLAQCQNLHAAKSMEMCLKLRSGNLVGPWRDLVLSIPLLVPEKGFKVLWLPLCSASSAAQPPVPSWHQNSLNFWSSQRVGLAVSMLVHPSPHSAGTFPPEWYSIMKNISTRCKSKSQLRNICSNDAFIALFLLLSTMVITWVSGRPCS